MLSERFENTKPITFIIVLMAWSVKNQPRVWSTPSDMKSAGNTSLKSGLLFILQ